MVSITVNIVQSVFEGGVYLGSLGNRFLVNFNDRTHVTSDVCFITMDGTLVFASRALLVTSCPGMLQLLYNTSGTISQQILHPFMAAQKLH